MTNLSRDPGRACPEVAKCYPRSMGQPVKLSDALVLDAPLIGGAAERSIAGQIEFWAGLGRAVESVLRTDSVLRLKQRGEAVPLSECLRTVDTRAGRRRVKAHLAGRPFPHFEPAAERPGFLVKIDEDGKRTLGRFVHREFRSAGRR
jgi:hypothetical protein